jgi:hypothetical protein
MYQTLEKVVRALTVLSVVAVLNGCSTLSVSTDYDPEVDFSTFKTYDWGSENPGAPRTIFESTLRGVVDEEMAARGFTLDSDNPDLLVVPHASLEEVVTGATVNHWNHHGWGWYGGWGTMGTSTVSVNSFNQGTLILDVVDKSANRMVWRGIAEKAVNDARVSRENLQPVVQRMLEDFPPS